MSAAVDESWPASCRRKGDKPVKALPQTKRAALTFKAVCVGTAAAVLLVATGATAASGAAREQNWRSAPCVAEGVDVNAVLGVTDRIIKQPLCPQAYVGEWYVPLTYWLAARSYADVPSPYPLSAPTPMDDFLAKLVAVRFVIDSGASTEQSYRFEKRDLTLRLGTLDEFSPPGFPQVPIVFMIAKLPPLPPGGHRVAFFYDLSAGNCDGLGTAPENCLPQGESYLGWCPFQVVTPAARPRD
jgi:hypothetical protein